MLFCFKNTMVSGYNNSFLLYIRYYLHLFPFQTAKDLLPITNNQNQNIFETKNKAVV